MCNIDALYEAYHKHTGYPETETYHTEKVRLAREAIRIHLKTCPECRYSVTHSNYNLVAPPYPDLKRWHAKNAKRKAIEAARKCITPQPGEIVTREGER